MHAFINKSANVLDYVDYQRLVPKGAIDRVEGKITRIIDNGFAMSVGATPRKRDKLAAQAFEPFFNGPAQFAGLIATGQS